MPVEEFEAWIVPRQFFPQPPHTEVLAPLVRVVQQDDRALREFRQPASEIVRDGLICMESVDMQEIDGAIRLIRTIRDEGATIVFVEHVMKAVWALTDRVVVLDHGQVIAEGAAGDVMARSAVVTAFLGKAHARA